MSRIPGTMKAVIMAGGEGSRLRPLTSNQPKPMVSLANRPIMEHILLLCKRHGFTDIVVTVQFLASLVRNYFGTGEDLGVSMTYATEEAPLGTAGSVKNARGALDETFLVISGDALTDIDLEKVVAFHQEREAMVTVVLSRQPDPLEYGIVVTDDEGRVERFLEKPGWGQVFSDTVNTGIYVLEPSIFDHIPDDEPHDFSKELFPKLLEMGAPIYGYIADGYWTDIGNVDAYRKAQQDALDGLVRIEMPGFEIADRVWVGEGAIVDPDARIEGPALIGEHVKIEAGATVREYCVIGHNTAVMEGAFLHRTIAYDNAYIGPQSNLRGCIIGRNTDIRANARVEEGVVVGDGTVIGKGAVLQPNVKIYPHKRVEAGAVISHSIIWESTGSRSLFGATGVSGLINVDITPDLAVRLGMAYASTLKRGATVVMSRDASRASRAIKRALIAGVNGAGVHVEDLEVAPVPVTRFQCRTTRARGGIAVETMPGERAKLELRFFDADGADLDEGTKRGIERVFFREDYRRAFPDEIGELRYPPRALEFYQTGILGSLDVRTIRSARVKSVVDAGFGPASLVLPALLGRVGSDTLIVNGYLDELRPTITASERAVMLAHLADVVRTSRADFGALLETSGETLDLIAEGGIPIPRAIALLLLVDIVSETHPGSPVVVPVSAPSAIEAIVEARGGAVVRSQRSPASILRAAIDTDACFAGTEEGTYVFPDSVPAFDAVSTFCRLHELLARTEMALGERMRSLPSTHVVHRAVPTAWDRKGGVMRRLASDNRADHTEETEGLKLFHGKDWALVIPDPEDPLTHVWAEAGSERESQVVADRYVALIEEAVD
ncbi:MAG: NTP transferase domain-containing protein [Actinobacteria bacterium]|nr:NTP transferase domain-containing protein [Actinomycetota bacterium]